MRRRVSPALWLSAAALLSGAGCAAILRGTNTTVTIRSDAPGAEVIVDGTPRGVTPVALALDHTTGHTVMVRRGGMARWFRLTTGVEPGWVVLDFFVTGLIGIVVDAASGAWNALSQDDIYAAFGEGSLLAPTLPPSPTPMTGAPWSGWPSE